MRPPPLFPNPAEKRRPPAGEAEMTPASNGYADGNGIKLYHEIYREGERWC
jgi:hypothetical protein